jgi:hypothetical protein
LKPPCGVRTYTKLRPSLSNSACAGIHSASFIVSAVITNIGGHPRPQFGRRIEQRYFAFEAAIPLRP